jgi:hypothetical protein
VIQFLCLEPESLYINRQTKLNVEADERFQDRFRPPLYHQPSRGSGPGRSDRDASDELGREQQGWAAYRKWLTTMNARPQARRAPIDHSVYSWKGYQSWADRVRQSWKPEDN